MLASTFVLTLTVALPVTVPPGPDALKSYVVVAWGETDWLPLVGTVPTPPLMFASTVSAVCQFSVADWPQLICVVEELKLPDTGATPMVALAMPALKRGISFIRPPRSHFFVVCAPFFPRSTTTF